MQDFAIRIKDMDTVKRFVTEMGRIDCDMDLIAKNRRYVVDAKSIMGILSLDLTGELTLRAYTDDPEVIGSIKSSLGRF